MSIFQPCYCPTLVYIVRYRRGPVAKAGFINGRLEDRPHNAQLQVYHFNDAGDVMVTMMRKASLQTVRGPLL